MRAFDTEGSFIHQEEELLHHHPVEATPDSTTCSPAGNKAAPPMNLIAAADRTPITPGDIAELVKSITSLSARGVSFHVGYSSPTISIEVTSVSVSIRLADIWARSARKAPEVTRDPQLDFPPHLSE